MKRPTVPQKVFLHRWYKRGVKGFRLLPAGTSVLQRKRSETGRDEHV